MNAMKPWSLHTHTFTGTHITQSHRHTHTHFHKHNTTYTTPRADVRVCDMLGAVMIDEVCVDTTVMLHRNDVSRGAHCECKRCAHGPRRLIDGFRGCTHQSHTMLLHEHCRRRGHTDGDGRGRATICMDAVVLSRELWRGAHNHRIAALPSKQVQRITSTHTHIQPTHDTNTHDPNTIIHPASPNTS